MAITTLQEHTANGAVIDHLAAVDAFKRYSRMVSLTDVNGQPIGLADSFGRLRVSQPYTMFDSKQLFDKQPLYWDDQEVSGSGTTSVHDVARAGTQLGVAANTAGKRVRQTFQRFNYQPGKSQFFIMTGVPYVSGGGSGITVGAGAGDDNNGVFMYIKDGMPHFAIRSSRDGSAVDNAVPYTEWNGDKLDGTGPSGLIMDPTKSHIFWFDMEWLGVGAVRCGVIYQGTFILCHTFHHVNVETGVYMSTPNLPLRYWIENDGTGQATKMEHICCTIMSEGGVQPQGQLQWGSTEDTLVTGLNSGDVYALYGLKLKSTFIGQQVDMVKASIISPSADDFEWLLIHNPTVAGTFTYTAHNGSAVNHAVGGGVSNTVTGGQIVDGGFADGKAEGSISSSLANALRLGAAIDGTTDTMVLCVRPFGTNATFRGGLGWRELS